VFGARRVRPVAAVAAVVAAVVIALGGMVGCSSSNARFHNGVGGTASSSTAAAKAGASIADPTFTLSAVGDTIMGAAPDFLPPNNGNDFFAPVEQVLRSDLQMANLEEPLTDVARSAKCADDLNKTCFAFRSPVSYARVLKDAGFDLVNLANNHTLDFGGAGAEQTKRSLRDAGVAYTGPPGMITMVTVKGIRIAVVGFAPYSSANDMRNIAAAQALVRTADRSADVVIIQVHMGGEGPDYQHVAPGTEMFLGENRGDPIAFSHAMIDAGADIVLGHSPHVLRAIEFYRGHLIAYSLGNFAGYHALTSSGVNGVSMIMRVTLRSDGSFVRANMVATSMVAPGVPRLDAKQRAIPLVRQLTEQDFPTSGAQIAADGTITPPSS